MFLCKLENDRQYKGTALFLHRHPFGCQHHPGAVVNAHHMMVIPDQLLRLLACADRDCLMRMDLVKRSGHAKIISLACPIRLFQIAVKELDRTLHGDVEIV
jgi:hypothetical protein